MRVFAKKINHKHLSKHETKKEALVRFSLVVGVFMAYFVFVSYKYGTKDGFFVAWLTWSAFVLGTPIADAGFLIDFPVRLLTGMRMLFSEIMVWIIAISLNLYAVSFHPEIYQSSTILKIFYQALTHPFPYWIIILISALGTFISIHFGDELLDKRHHHERKFYHKHKSKYKFVIMAFLFALVIIIYHMVVKQLGVKL